MPDLSISPEGRFAEPSDQKARLQQVANQLEGLFIGMLFKQMEDSGMDDDALFGSSPASKQYNELFHTALTEKSAGSLGLADSIFKQLAVRAGIERQTLKPPVTPPRPASPPAPEPP